MPSCSLLINMCNVLKRQKTKTKRFDWTVPLLLKILIYLILQYAIYFDAGDELVCPDLFSPETCPWQKDSTQGSQITGFIVLKYWKFANCI